MAQQYMGIIISLTAKNETLHHVKAVFETEYSETSLNRPALGPKIMAGL
jgi:hypothetical protein